MTVAILMVVIGLALVVAGAVWYVLLSVGRIERAVFDLRVRTDSLEGWARGPRAPAPSATRPDRGRGR